jgi:TolB-like protein/tetratricopeptide (TPR) repeat protein
MRGTMIRFGEFKADLKSREVFRGNRKVPLQDKPSELLTALLEHPGELVTRTDLASRLWPNIHVEVDASLNTAVRKLRAALDDDAGDPTYVETVGSLGYRLIAHPSLSPGRDNHKKRLAVIPFENLGMRADQYLSHGLADELIARLGRMRLDVALLAPETTCRLQAQGWDTATLRSELNVDYALHGSIRRANGQVRVIARLVETEGGSCLWSEIFDRPQADLQDIQQQVAMRIGSAVAPHLPQKASAAGVSTTDSAHDKYLKGCFYFRRQLRPGFEKCLRFFQEALEDDPAYVPAHCALAYAYIIVAAQMQPEAVEKARWHAEQALKVAPDTPEALSTLATVWVMHDWKWGPGEKLYLRSLELNPNLTLTHWSYAHLLTVLGRHEDAIAAGRKACELDPLADMQTAMLAAFYFHARRYRLALQCARAAMRMEPNSLPGLWSLLTVTGALKLHPKTLRPFQKLLTDNPLPAFAQMEAYAWAVAGYQKEARSRLDRILEAQRSGQFFQPTFLAFLYAALGETDAALRSVETAFEEHCHGLLFINVDPRLDPLRKEPRFRRIVRAMNLDPDAAPAYESSDTKIVG